MKKERIKLDRSSLTLILIALLGISWSMYSLFKDNESNFNASDKKLVAKVTNYKQDTRLKRSDDLHWFQVNQDLNCYVNDSVFTGPDSYATVQFTDGSSVTLYPNSLVSLDEGYVSLNSGTIEVNLEKGKLAVESFGEVFKIKEKTKFRLENTAEVKKIVPLVATEKPIVKETRLQQFVQTEVITLLNPVSGITLPKFQDGSVAFNWKATGAQAANKLFKLEFARDENFKDVFLSDETVFSSVKVLANKLPAGIVHWRVSLNNQATGKSSFYFTDDFKIEQIRPSQSIAMPLKQANSTGVEFEWTNPLKLPQRLQISRTEDFGIIVIDEPVTVTTRQFTFASEGPYYWRVGYPHNNNKFAWSETRYFEVKPDIIFSPMEFARFPNPLDFALITQFPIEVKDPNNCEEYHFSISQEGKVISELKTKMPLFNLGKIPDGTYMVTVKGKHTQKDIEGTTSKMLVVKTSPPLEAPKIKKKNVKLFVKVMREIFNFFIPTAAAAPNYFYNLEWEPEENASYEIEISKSQSKQVIHKEQIDVNSYRFVIPGPETYYWRVRINKDGRWGPFTEYAMIQVEDKISKYTKPLMTKPADGKNVTLKTNKQFVNLHWKEPFANASYFLEIYANPNQKPMRTMKVSNRMQELKFAKVPKRIYWRVFAQSKFGNRTSNTEKYKLDMQTEQHYYLPQGQYLARFDLFQSISNLTLETPGLKESQDMSGKIMTANLEFFPEKLPNNSFNFSFRDSTLTGKDIGSLKEQKFGIEMGFKLKKEGTSHHRVYASYFLTRKFDFELGSDLQASYSASFVGARYLYRRPLSEKFKFETNLGFQMPAAIGFAPTFTVKPGINFKIADKWWLDFFGLYERYFTSPENSASNDKVDITLQNMGAGIGFTWIPGEAPF